MNRSVRNLIRVAAKATIWLLVVSILLGSMPIPLGIVSINSAEDGEAFPCQGGHCGCKTALQCWTSCCCHSPAERVEWAAKHNVAIPEYAQNLHQQALLEKAKNTKPSCCQTKPSCCQAKAKTSCCQQKDDTPKKPTCCVTKTSTTKQVSTKRTRVVLSMFALGCRGSAGELANLPWAIVQLSHSQPMALGPIEYRMPVFNIKGPEQFYDLELPPPRLS